MGVLSGAVAQGRCVEVVRATPEDIVAALLHFESYPEWQAGVLATKVLSRDEQGRGSLIEVRVDAKVRKLRVVVRAIYDGPYDMRCEYVTGDVKDYRISYAFEARPDGSTTVIYDIAIELPFPLPNKLKQLLTEHAMRDTIDSLRRRVEA